MSKTIADLIQDRFGLPTAAGAGLPAEGTVAQLLAHRTHRRYRPEPVPDEGNIDDLRRQTGHDNLEDAFVKLADRRRRPSP